MLPEEPLGLAKSLVQTARSPFYPVYLSLTDCANRRGYTGSSGLSTRANKGGLPLTKPKSHPKAPKQTSPPGVWLGSQSTRKLRRCGSVVVELHQRALPLKGGNSKHPANPNLFGSLICSLCNRVDKHLQQRTWRP